MLWSSQTNVMFERYTDEARRTVFFAPFEASQFGTPYIGLEHLLLGLSRADRPLVLRMLGTLEAVESVRQKIAESLPAGQRI